jgi:hypothetical protein
MIDTNFIVRYTNGLYATAPEYSPRYDEFRDMFSSGQLASKEWLIHELNHYSALVDNSSIVIAGAWFATLGIMLNKKFPTAKISMIDIDERCKPFVDNITHDLENVDYAIEDMYRHVYREQVVINTSCEHIPNLKEWVSIIPKNKTLVLQSNNYTVPADHINTANSVEEFIEQTGLSAIWYSGSLVLPMYTRYMLIGRT